MPQSARHRAPQDGHRTLGRTAGTTRSRNFVPVIASAIVGLLLIGPGIVSTAASTLIIPSRSTATLSFETADRSGQPASPTSATAEPSAAPAPPAAAPAPAPTPVAPPAPVQDPRGPATTLAAGDRGVTLTWASPVAAAAASYLVTRQISGAAPTTVTTLGAATTTFTDISVTPGANTAYTVTAVDSAGAALGVSLPVSTVIPGVSPGTGRRLATCPAATVAVDSAASLTAALASAGPGTVIRLAPGNYQGEFEVRGSGAPGAPIWVCGPRSAIITSGSPSSGHGMTVDGKHDVVLAGFTISNVFKGVTIISSQRVTTTDLLVERVGFEAIHLRRQTTDSEVTFNEIRKIGLTKPDFGEGVYIGTSDSNWCEYNDCQPDTTSGIRVYGNVISETGAQAIEVKPGTSNGVIAANVMTGGQSDDGWITVKGNGWLVADNTGTSSNSHGFATNASVPGWGRDNIFTRNSASNTAKYGTWVHKLGGNDTLGNRISCLQTTVATAAGAMNIGCEG